jgi:L-threo-3-deoxy-hexylosonate aldolase
VKPIQSAVTGGPLLVAPAERDKMRELKPGLYGPLPTFFDDDQELDFVSYKKHLLSISTPGSIDASWG